MTGTIREGRQVLSVDDRMLFLKMETSKKVSNFESKTHAKWTQILVSVITAKIGNVVYHAISEQYHDEDLIIKYYFPDDFPAN